MVTEIINKILNDLTQLLSDDLHPHSISYQFEKIATLLNKECLRIEKTDCREYYADKDLTLILLMKNEAIQNGQFELASKFRVIESELLQEKSKSNFIELKIEPSFFEYGSNSVIFHFNKRKENQRLIANLIEGYNIVQKKAPSQNALYC